MKKIISFVTAALCGAMLLTSCSSGLSEKTVEENPGKEVADSAVASVEGALEKSPFAVAGKIADSKKIHVNFTADISGIEMGMEFWSNLSDSTAAYNVALDDYEVTAHLDPKKHYIVQSDSILGGEAYGFALDNLEDRIRDSVLLEDLDVDYEDIEDELEPLLNVFNSMSDTKDYYDMYNDLKEGIFDAIRNGDYEVTRDTVDVNDGEVDAIVIEYEVTSDVVIDVMDVFFDSIEDIGIFEEMDYDIDDERSYMEEDIEYWFEYMDIDAVPVQIAINQKNGELVYAEIEIPDECVLTFDLGADPASSEEWVITYEDDYEEFEIVITKIFTPDEVEFGIEVDGDELFAIIVEDGDLELSVDGDTVAEGTCAYSEKSLDIVINEIMGEDVTIGILVDTEYDPPKAPSSFIDILDMTEDELQDLADDFYDIQEEFEDYMY